MKTGRCATMCKLFSYPFFVNILKRKLWLGVLLTLFTFLSSTLPFLMMAPESSLQAELYSRPPLDLIAIFDSSNIILSMLMLLAPVVIGISVFAFLNSKPAIDLYNSLPVTREKSFVTHTLAGLVLLILPIILNFAAVLILWAVHGFNFYIPTVHVAGLMGSRISLMLCMYGIGLFAAMITGNVIVQGLFAFFIAVFHLCVYSLSQVLPEFFLCGYFSNFSSDIVLWSPVSQIAMIPDVTFVVAIIDILVGILLTVAALFIFKIRKSESAGETVAFEPMKPVIKYMITFLGTLVAGVVFHSMRSDTGWGYFGYFIGALITFVISEAIIQKGFKEMLSKTKEFAIYLLVFAACHFLLLNVDITGFEKRVPDVSNVEYAIMTDSLYNRISDLKSLEPDQLKLLPLYQDENTLGLITKMHRLHTIDKNVNGRTVYFTYKTKDNRYIARRYHVNNTDQYMELWNALAMTPQYKRNYYIPLRLEDFVPTSIHISNAFVPQRPISFNYSENEYTSAETNNKIERLYEAIKLDLKHDTESPIASDRAPFIELSFGYNDSRDSSKSRLPHYIGTWGNFGLRASYTNTIALLKEFGIEVDINYDNIRSLEIYDNKNPENQVQAAKPMAVSEIAEVTEITDKDEIIRIISKLERPRVSTEIYPKRVVVRSKEYMHLGEYFLADE